MYQSRCSLSGDERALLNHACWVAGVVDDQVHDHADAALMRLVDESRDVVDVAVVGQDGAVVGDVVSAVTQRALLEREQPDAVDSEPLEVLELADQSGEVADAVVVAVVERPDGEFVEHRSLEPERVLGEVDERAHCCLRTCRMWAGCWAGSRRT